MEYTFSSMRAKNIFIKLREMPKKPSPMWYSMGKANRDGRIRLYLQLILFVLTTNDNFSIHVKNITTKVL